MQGNGQGNRAVAAGVIVGSLLFLAAMVPTLLEVTGGSRALTADSGMMAGLAPMFAVLWAGLVATGLGFVAALSAVASMVAVRRRSALAGAACGLVAAGAAFVLGKMLSDEAATAWEAAARIGIPVLMAGLVAGAIGPGEHRRASWRDAGPATPGETLRAAGERLRELAVPQRSARSDAQWSALRRRAWIPPVLGTGCGLCAAFLIQQAGVEPWAPGAGLGQALRWGAWPWSRWALDAAEVLGPAGRLPLVFGAAIAVNVALVSAAVIAALGGRGAPRG